MNKNVKIFVNVQRLESQGNWQSAGAKAVMSVILLFTQINHQIAPTAGS